MAKQTDRYVWNSPSLTGQGVRMSSYAYKEGSLNSVTNETSIRMRELASIFLGELKSMHQIPDTHIDFIVPNRDLGIEAVVTLLEASTQSTIQDIAVTSQCPKHIQKTFHVESFAASKDASVAVVSLTDENVLDHLALLERATECSGRIILDIKSASFADELKSAKSDLSLRYANLLRTSKVVAAIVAQEQFTGEIGVAGLYLFPAVRELPDFKVHLSELFGVGKPGYFISRGMWGATTVPVFNVIKFLELRGKFKSIEIAHPTSRIMASEARDTTCKFGSMNSYALVGPAMNLGVMGQLITHQVGEKLISTNGKDFLAQENHKLEREYAETLRTIFRIPQQLTSRLYAPSGSKANEALARLALQRMLERGETRRTTIVCSELAHSSVKKLPSAKSIPVHGSTFQMNEEKLLAELESAAVVFAIGTQTNTGVVEQLGERALQYIEANNIPIVVDACAAGVTACLPDKIKMDADDNSPELVRQYDMLLSHPNVIGVSTDLGKLAGPVGQLAVAYFDEQSASFAEQICAEAHTSAEGFVGAYSCQELSATIAASGMTEVTAVGVPGIRYQVFQTKMAARRIAAQLRKLDYNVLPVHGNSITVALDSKDSVEYLLRNAESGLGMYVASAVFPLDDGQHFNGIRVVLPLRPTTVWDERSVVERIATKVPNMKGAVAYQGILTVGDPELVFYRRFEHIRQVAPYFEDSEQFLNGVMLTEEEQLYEQCHETLSHQFHNLGISLARELFFCIEGLQRNLANDLTISLEAVGEKLEEISSASLVPWGLSKYNDVGLAAELPSGLFSLFGSSAAPERVHELTTDMNIRLRLGLQHISSSHGELTGGNRVAAKESLLKALRVLGDVPHIELSRDSCRVQFRQPPALSFDPYRSKA